MSRDPWLKQLRLAGHDASALERVLAHGVSDDGLQVAGQAILRCSRSPGLVASAVTLAESLSRRGWAGDAELIAEFEHARERIVPCFNLTGGTTLTALRVTAADRAGILGRLERDWEAWSTSRRGRVLVAGWREQPGGRVFEGMVTLADVVEALHGFHTFGAHSGADGALGALIRSAQAGDEMALRTVTQAMLRFAVALTAAYRRGGADPDEAAAEVLGALQHRILNHKLDAHPTMIAGHLSLTVPVRVAGSDGSPGATCRPNDG